MWNKIFYLLLLFGSVTLAAGAQPVVRAGVDSPRAFIGSPVTLRLQLSGVPAGSAITFPLLSQKLGALEIVDKGPIDTIKEGKHFLLEQKVTLLGFDSGLFPIPALAFKVAEKTLLTDAASVFYTPLPVDTAAPIRPIRDIIAAPPAGINWVKWVLMGVGILLLAALLLWLWKWYKKAQPLYRQRPVVNTAQALQSLGAAGLATRAFYTQLAQILRDALSQKWELPVRRQTTAQTIAQGHIRLDANAVPLLNNLLTEADSVKFARQERSEVQKEAALAQALELVTKAQLP